MAGAPGHTIPDLIRRLTEAPHQWSFESALRHLEAAAGGPGFGRTKTLSEDPVRFSQDASLAFAPAPARRVAHGTVPRIDWSLQGLLGPNGALPNHFTEFVRQRERNQADPTHVRFLDLFHHRMLGFLYRAWADGQAVVGYERADRDRFARYVASLFGLGLDPLRFRDAVPDSAKFHFVGRMSSLSKNLEGLEAVLGEDLGLPVRIEPFVGHWLELPPDQQCRLGESPSTGALGTTAIAGSRVWDCQSKFRVLIGPLSLKEFESLLPDPTAPGEPVRISQRQMRLRDWIRGYVGFEFSWDVLLILRRDEVPPTRLGTAGRLGFTSWSKTQTHPRDVAEVVLDLESF